jgi:hypothetical protein
MKWGPCQGSASTGLWRGAVSSGAEPTHELTVVVCAATSPSSHTTHWHHAHNRLTSAGSACLVTWATTRARLSRSRHACCRCALQPPAPACTAATHASVFLCGPFLPPSTSHHHHHHQTPPPNPYAGRRGRRGQQRLAAPRPRCHGDVPDGGPGRIRLQGCCDAPAQSSMASSHELFSLTADPHPTSPYHH